MQKEIDCKINDFSRHMRPAPAKIYAMAITALSFNFGIILNKVHLPKSNLWNI